MPTESVEDYLKTIYVLASSRASVRTGDVAEQLDVSPASVSAMVKRLAQRQLVAHEPFGDLRLTPEGEDIALRVIRRHRLIETFLHDVVGFGLHELHEEAEVLEHVISWRLESRMAEMLGFPKYDPHGDPIPPVEGAHTEHIVRHRGLTDVPLDTRVRIERVPDHDAKALQFLAGLGLRPGSKVIVLRHDPFGGPLWLRCDGSDNPVAVSTQLAELVMVSVVEDDVSRDETR